MKPLTTPHFELIASALDRARAGCGTDFAADREIDAIDRTARNLADALATTNPRFDRARFLAACGVAP
jgi:hypothetical protein